MQRAEDDIRKALVTLYPRLRRFAETLTGSTDGADDLVQVTCEHALRRAGQWSPSTPLMNWLFGVMNEAWEAERHGSLGDALSPSDATLAREYRAVEDIEDRVMLEAVRRRLLDLPEGQRSVLTLVCVDGFSYREAAEKLNIRIGTVMSRIFRGRVALARMLSRKDRVTSLGRAATTR
jgi:RNA polymerase sigma-70 factor (ECF subfamily)